MKGFFAWLCSGLFLLAGLVFAQDDDAYASVYSSPEATSQVPQNLVIAKGLPPVQEVGIAAVKRIWDSYRTPAPAKKLIPVRSQKRTLPPAASAAQGAPRPRE